MVGLCLRTSSNTKSSADLHHPLSMAFRTAGLIRISVIPFLLLTGCAPSEPAPKPVVVPPSLNGKLVYPLTGVVRKIDRASGVVMIQHDEIPGYMTKMTMPFNLKNESVLEELEPGDQVVGSLVVNDEHSRLTDVYVTRPAEPEDRSAPVEALPDQRIALGTLVPDFLMTTQEGKPLRLSEYKGHPVVLTFIYTRCPLPDYCPLLDRKFSELSRRLAKDGPSSVQTRLLSISFDPEHDTAAVLAKHAKLLGALPPEWTFAVASHEELKKVAEPLGLSYVARTQEIAHTLSTAVIAPDGTLLGLFQGNQWSSEDVLALLALYRTGQNTIQKPDPDTAVSP